VGYFLGMAGNKNEVIQTQREDAAYILRVKNGLTFDQIAERLGYANRSGAMKAFARALERLAPDNAEDVYMGEFERLDSLTEAFWQRAINGDIKTAYLVKDLIADKMASLKPAVKIKIEAEVINYDGYRGLDAEVSRLARVIEYIEGDSANITTLPDKQSKGEPNSLETPSAEGTVTA
jgi:hypothetical protein